MSPSAPACLTDVFWIKLDCFLLTSTDKKAKQGSRPTHILAEQRWLPVGFSLCVGIVETVNVKNVKNVGTELDILLMQSMV